MVAARRAEMKDWPCLVNTEEELSDAYNWDYLSNWGPRYQPLSAVFAEIARLKGAVKESDLNGGGSGSGTPNTAVAMNKMLELRLEEAETGSQRSAASSHHSHSHHSHHSLQSSRSGPPGTGSEHKLLRSKQAPFSSHSAFTPFSSSASSSGSISGKMKLPTTSGASSSRAIKPPAEIFTPAKYHHHTSGIGSASSSDGSTGTAVFVDSNSMENMRI